MAMGDRYTRLLMGLPSTLNPYDMGSDIMQQGMLGYDYAANQPSSGMGPAETAGPRFASDAARMQFFNNAPFGSISRPTPSLGPRYPGRGTGLGGFGRAY